MVLPNSTKSVQRSIDRNGWPITGATGLTSPVLEEVQSRKLNIWLNHLAHRQDIYQSVLEEKYIEQSKIRSLLDLTMHSGGPHVSGFESGDLEKILQGLKNDVASEKVSYWRDSMRLTSQIFEEWDEQCRQARKSGLFKDEV